MPCSSSMRAELDRVGRTGFGAGGLQPTLQAVVAEGALHRRARDRVDLDHAEGAGRDAVAAAVADVGLDDDGVVLGADDGPGGTDLQAAGVDAVLADVAHQQPAAAGAILRELLDELDVPPVLAVELPRVVVGVAAEGEDVRGETVPVLAGDLAGLAADADGGVGEEPHRGRGEGPCRRQLRAGRGFSGSCGLCGDRGRLGWDCHHAFSTLQTNALHSWMVTLGSPTMSERSLVTAPVTRPW